MSDRKTGRATTVGELLGIDPDWCGLSVDDFVRYQRRKLWPWQIPGNPGPFNAYGAYRLAYLNPAVARATGHDGLVTYLFAAYVRETTAS